MHHVNLSSLSSNEHWLSLFSSVATHEHMHSQPSSLTQPLDFKFCEVPFATCRVHHHRAPGAYIHCLAHCTILDLTCFSCLICRQDLVFSYTSRFIVSSTTSYSVCLLLYTTCFSDTGPSSGVKYHDNIVALLYCFLCCRCTGFSNF
jgi:hypothetical protein